MAVRSGAGTGVVVSLVVFVLTSVFLLILTIVFYAGKDREFTDRVKAQDTLKVYVDPSQMNSDAFRAIEGVAKASPQRTVAGYLNARNEAVMGYLSGNPSATLDSVKDELSKLGVPKENGVVRTALVDLNRDLRNSKNEIDSLKQQQTDLNNQLAAKQAEMDKLKGDHQKDMDAVEGRIAAYRDAGSEFKKKLEDAIAELNKAKDKLKSDYEGQVRELRDENDNLGRETTMLRQRIAEYEKARNETRLKASDPAALVDGEIVDSSGSNEEVTINRGKKDRMVLGMTFEVYAEKTSIRANPQTGELPRGKASLQVIKVGDVTSTCKITRNLPGQPVVRGDVIANAVYDPKYQFKFLIHGKFDIDNDGKPTETEAEYLRSLVLEWGGAIVTGEEIPGDLDFLVLGVEPPNPPPPPASASEVVVNDYIHKRQAHDTYLNLFKQAREAQIPVLNANRFFILIGHTDR